MPLKLDRAKVGRVVGNRLVWLLAVVGLSLLHLLLSLGHSWLKPNPLIDLQTQVFLSGSLLFFCSGVLVTTAFDVWLERNVSNDGILYIVSYILLPLVLLLLITFVYVETLNDVMALDETAPFQIGIFILTTLYMLGAKIHVDVARLPKKRAKKTT